MLVEPMLAYTSNPASYNRFGSLLIATLPPSFFVNQTHLLLQPVAPVDLNSPLYPNEYLQMYVTQIDGLEFFDNTGQVRNVELPAFVCDTINTPSISTTARFFWDVSLVAGSGSSKDAVIDGVYLQVNDNDAYFPAYPDVATATKYTAVDSLQLNQGRFDIALCAKVTGTGTASLSLKDYRLDRGATTSKVATVVDPVVSQFRPWDDDRFFTVPAEEVNPTPENPKPSSAVAAAASAVVMLVASLMM